jgi:hypothetical protein
MAQNSNENVQRFGAWAGPISLGIWIIVLWPLTHYIPPPAPTLTTPEVVALYAGHSSAIRIASMLILMAITFTTLFYAAISAQIRRMEGDVPIWTYAQMLNGLLSLVGFVTIAILWAASAYRPGRSPEIIQAFHDESWLLYSMVAPPAFMQCIAVGFAVLGDKTPIAIFPRWLAYLSIWTGILFLPGVLACMFKTGPFAWDGLFAFWIPLSVFGLWVCVMCWAMLKAADRPKAFN